MSLWPVALVVGMAANCAAIPAPAIAVSLAEIPASITAAAPAALPDHAEGHYSGDIGIRYDVTASTVQTPAGLSCAAIEAITITLTHTAALRIADTHAPGSCFHAAIMDHEQDHAEIDRRLLRKFGPRIEDGLKLAYATAPDYTAGPFPAGQGAKDEAARFGPAVMAVVEVLTADMFRQREAAQAGLDTPESYRALTASCPR